MELDFGIFMLMQQRNNHKSSTEILFDAVEQTQLADRLGFGCAWFAEHHFSNYGLCSSPLTMIAHCAATTQNIRLGSGVLVTPLYTPARLLADIAMVDQLSRGRLNLGLGSGYQQFEFERFGISLDSAKGRSWEMLDVIELGLTKSRFDYQGEFYQQPMTAISQRPIQTPMPPVWITSLDERFMARAIQSGHHLFVSGFDGGVERLQSTRTRIDQAAAVQGKRPSEVKVGLLRSAFASNDRAEVERYLECARYQRRVSASLKHRTAQIADDYQVAESEVPGEPSSQEMLSNMPIGDVDTVIKRVVQEIRILKPDHFCIQTQLGDFDHGAMLRQLELWSSTIIPAVRQELARDLQTSKPEASAAIGV